MKSTTETKIEKEWYECARHARPFSEVEIIPPELKIPTWFPVILFIVMILAFALGYFRDVGLNQVRLAEGIFQASLFVYIAVSTLDLWEHFRLEKYVTGSYLSATVVPAGESATHLCILLILTSFIQFARPFSSSFGIIDWFLLFGPIAFLAAGWFDEIRYHRRRALHREDILHTVSHLAAGAMVASLIVARMINWS